MEQVREPRGIRNNNPLNIRIGNAWVGEVEHPTDPDFEQFTDIVYGLRAGFMLLRRYIERYKLNTIEKIISRWAPRSENNTAAYIDHVSKMMKISPTEKLSFRDDAMMVSLVWAMIMVECGTQISVSKIKEGYLLALHNFVTY